MKIEIRSHISRIATCLAILCALSTGSQSLFAADASRPKKTTVLAVVGGDVITVTQGTVRNGTVLVEDGKISAVGNDVEIPEDAEVIDASGMTVTPGFIALNMSRVGLSTSRDGKGKYVDGLDPFDDNVKLSLGVCITTGCVLIQTSGGRG